LEQRDKERERQKSGPGGNGHGRGNQTKFPIAWIVMIIMSLAFRYNHNIINKRIAKGGEKPTPAVLISIRAPPLHYYYRSGVVQQPSD